MTESGAARHVGDSFERAMWLFTRLSALVLVAMAAISLALALRMGGRTMLDLPALLRWTFFPNPNHVVNSAIPDVAAGWSGGFFRLYSIVMVFLAIAHGANGLRMILEDFVARPLAVWALRSAMLVGWFVGLVIAVAVVRAS